jgi:hypothetical protein
LIQVLFPPDWPWTTILLISASQAVGFIGICRHAWLLHFYLFIFAIGVWTQCLHLEPLHQVFFVTDRLPRTICLGWLWTEILLISASWVARIISVSQASGSFFFLGVCIIINLQNLYFPCFYFLVTYCI